MLKEILSSYTPKKIMTLPQEHDNSNQNNGNTTPSPYQLKPMVDPTLTSEHTFDSMMEGFEIEYGDGKNIT